MTHALPTRPHTFECPWCGPNGVTVDRTLPLYLRVCDGCLPYPTIDAAPVVTVDPAVESLRAILASHVRDFSQPWHGHNFGKAIIGNAILGALASYGCDPATELRAAIHPTSGTENA